MEYPFEQSNMDAIQKFIDTFPETAAFKFREFFEQDPVEHMSYLRNVLGFKCAACGGYVTYPNFRFNHYSPLTFCYNCQGVKKQTYGVKQ